MSEIKPVRLQRSRAKGAKLVSPNGLPVKYVGRPGEFSNPFRVGDWIFEEPGWCHIVKVPPPNARLIGWQQVRDRAHAVELFERWSIDPEKGPAYISKQLRGMNLACWCPLDGPCHADTLLRIANED